MKLKYRKAIFIVAYSIVKEKPKYLIFKRKLHWKGWEIVKGGKEKFELDKTTAKREIKEETGLRLIKLKKFKEKGQYKYKKILKDRPGIIGQTYKLFSAELKKGKISKKKLNPEHLDYEWMDFDEALKKLTWGNQKKCLKIVNEKLSK